MQSLVLGDKKLFLVAHLRQQRVAQFLAQIEDAAVPVEDGARDLLHAPDLVNRVQADGHHEKKNREIAQHQPGK